VSTKDPNCRQRRAGKWSCCESTASCRGMPQQQFVQTHVSIYDTGRYGTAARTCAMQSRMMGAATPGPQRSPTSDPQMIVWTV
jgi:hypothetical protein